MAGQRSVAFISGMIWSVDMSVPSAMQMRCHLKGAKAYRELIG
jgi:hypothetical protein